LSTSRRTPGFCHADIYPLIQSAISAALASDSVHAQASALLVFRIVLDHFEDVSNLDEVLGCLSRALQSGVVLLQAVSLQIIAAFSDCLPSISAHVGRFSPT
jgi:hypothetical protein